MRGNETLKVHCVVTALVPRLRVQNRDTTTLERGENVGTLENRLLVFDAVVPCERHACGVLALLVSERRDTNCKYWKELFLHFQERAVKILKSASFRLEMILDLTVSSGPWSLDSSKHRLAAETPVQHTWVAF